MFHAVLRVTFSVLGICTRSEVSTACGCADMVVEVPKYGYVIELKFGGSAQKALTQIESRGYSGAYADDGREVVKVGIVFDSEAR